MVLNTDLDVCLAINPTTTIIGTTGTIVTTTGTTLGIHHGTTINMLGITLMVTTMVTDLMDTVTRLIITTALMHTHLALHTDTEQV